MYDIVFISYHEANADKNWADLKARFPRAQRIDGVKGVVAAHQAAAAKCQTKWFWVVDADNQVDPAFDFSFRWPMNHPHSTSVAVWRAVNNVNGLVYGYGGIKLLPRRRVLEIDPTVVDFTTSIGDQFNVINEVASITMINGSPFEAWKSGFREAAKLASSVIHRQNSEETESRLHTWCNFAEGDYYNEVVQGARAGRDYGTGAIGNLELLARLNDFDWLRAQYDAWAGDDDDDDASTVVTSSILRGLEDLYPEKPFIRSLRHAMAEYPKASWVNALSHGQIASKRWLVDNLIDVMWGGNPEARIAFPGHKDPEDYLKKIYICGSWYGTLADMMLDRIGPNRIGQIRGLDMDQHAVEVANRLMKHWDDGWKFKSTLKDIRELTFEEDRLVFAKHDGTLVERLDTPSMIINTSIEHIDGFNEWYNRIPRGRFLIMQSNDYFSWPEHVNCSADLDAFAKQTPMKHVYFSGALPLEKYTRFMRIGIR